MGEPSNLDSPSERTGQPQPHRGSPCAAALRLRLPGEPMSNGIVLTGQAMRLEPGGVEVYLVQLALCFPPDSHCHSRTSGMNDGWRRYRHNLPLPHLLPLLYPAASLGHLLQVCWQAAPRCGCGPNHQRSCPGCYPTSTSNQSPANPLSPSLASSRRPGIACSAGPNQRQSRSCSCRQTNSSGRHSTNRSSARPAWSWSWKKTTKTSHCPCRCRCRWGYDC
mmetsp:Transcript_52772/g.115319  ORF Transcript_52772/g.115319 Transcript_52772/m.115319 type:complete len:221 (-) Transcript_52772:378-1040(-)